MSIYGYARVSTRKQNLSRQIENLSKYNPNITIIEEKFTGTKIEGRTQFNKLLAKVKKGDCIVFDSVSRMSRNAQEGYALYKELYEKGIDLVFLKESFINTEVYRENIKNAIKMYENTTSDNQKATSDATSILISSIFDAIKKYTFSLIEEQIKRAFEASEQEAKTIRERVKEGLREAKARGVTGGSKKGQTRERKNKQEMMQLILKKSVHFQGSMNDYELSKVIGLSRVTIIKYRKELVEKLQSEENGSCNIA